MVESHENETSQTDLNKMQPLAENANGEAHEKVDESAEIVSMQKIIAELESQLKEKESKFLYLYADFENFKKRSIKERSDLIKFGWESVARDLIVSLDNFERTLEHVPPDTDSVWINGLVMTLDGFKSTLKKQGVCPIESTQKIFDPNLHEAIEQEYSDAPSGVIIKEHTCGYTLHGRLLRAARVTISNGQNEQTKT